MELNFKDFYSLEQYKELAQVELNEQNKEKPVYDKIFEQQQQFQNGVLNYLKSRAENNMLEMPKGSDTHYSNLLTYWKNLVEKKLKSHEEHNIEYLFSKVISTNMNKFIFSKEDITIEDNYKNLIEKVNNGNFERFELDCESECFGCGKRMRLAAKDWKFEMKTVELNELNKLEFKSLPECISKEIMEVSVEFTTGELLIADWFRIPEFNKQVEYDPEYKKLSINTDLGQIKSTQHAAQLGFVTVHVGNSSPSIYQNNGNLIFGYMKEDAHLIDYKDKGSVCTDLWNVTIIDKSRLIEIVAQTSGLEEAQKTVNKYLEEEKSNINFLNVEAGKYTIGFCPRKNINKLDEDLPKEIETIFSMKRELPKKKLKM